MNGLRGVVFLEILYMIAFLALISAGLAIVFGMMRVINLAHGEFVMIGGYTTIVSPTRRHRHLVRDAGARAARRRDRGPCRRAARRPLPLRPDDRHDARDLGAEPADGRARHADLRQHRGQRAGADPGYQVGAYQMGGYNLFIIAVARLVMLLLWLVLRYTRIGLVARGAMQNADVASSLGYNPQQDLHVDVHRRRRRCPAWRAA